VSYDGCADGAQDLAMTLDLDSGLDGRTGN
jgi:hypothetical protein